MKNVNSIYNAIAKCAISLLMVSSGFSAFAQKSANKPCNIYLDNVQYTHAENTKDKSVAGTISSILNVATSKSSTKEMDSYVPAVGTAVKRAVSRIPRLVVKEGFCSDNPSDTDFIISSEVTSIGTSSSFKNNISSESAFVKMTITLKRLNTGEIFVTQDFSSDRPVSTYYNTPEKALSAAISDIQASITDYLWAVFPVQGSIIEPSLLKKDKIKNVYIDLGSADGVYKGQHFKIFQTGSVAGHDTKKEIGQLKIETIQGDEISDCKITKGNDAVKAAIESGSSLIVKNTYHHGLFR